MTYVNLIRSEPKRKSIEMYVIVDIISLVFMFSISITYAEGPPSLGISSCNYYGGIDEQCNKQIVAVEKLPSECTSFIFDGLAVNSNFEVGDSYGGNNPTFLTNLLASKKPIFLFYSHDQWKAVLNCDDGAVNTQTVMNNLKTFLDANKGISGLIIEKIDIFVPGELNQINENLKAYLTTMKSTFPNLALGLNVLAYQFMDICCDPAKCVNFCVLDPSLDFYFIHLVELNECSDTVKCTLSPLKGNAYTLEELSRLLDKLKIPKDKTYFFYRGRPLSSKDYWCTTYEELCTNSNITSLWCADTQQSYSDNGKFAKDHGAGFAVECIDLIDTNSCCQCDHPFPSFYFLLNGFNNVTGKPCPLFDKNCANQSH